MTVVEAAKALWPSPTEVYGLCRERQLRHSRVGRKRGRIVIEPADLAAYRQSCVMEPIAPAQRPLLLPSSAPTGRKDGGPLLRLEDALAAQRAERRTKTKQA
jgi:hypothetical protein